MGKIIAVWGSPGSGKSTVAGSLAYLLATSGKNVILIDTSTQAPQKSIWFPYCDGDFTSSLNSLMSADSITPAFMTKHISTLSSNLGVLGFVKGETPLSLTKAQRLDKIKDVYKVCCDLADYVIVDCASNILDNIYSVVALEQAIRVLRIVSPDLKGATWTMGNLQLISDRKFTAANHIVISNNVKSYYNVPQIEAVIGDYKTCLPYCVDIEMRNITGELFKPFNTKDLVEYKDMLLAALGVIN